MTLVVIYLKLKTEQKGFIFVIRLGLVELAAVSVIFIFWKRGKLFIIIRFGELCNGKQRFSLQHRSLLHQQTFTGFN